MDLLTTVSLRTVDDWYIRNGVVKGGGIHGVARSRPCLFTCESQSGRYSSELTSQQSRPLYCWVRSYARYLVHEKRVVAMCRQLTWRSLNFSFLGSGSCARTNEFQRPFQRCVHSIVGATMEVGDFALSDPLLSAALTQAKRPTNLLERQLFAGIRTSRPARGFQSHPSYRSSIDALRSLR
jgi:hypothetical protein